MATRIQFDFRKATAAATTLSLLLAVLFSIRGTDAFSPSATPPFSSITSSSSVQRRSAVSPSRYTLDPSHSNLPRGRCSSARSIALPTRSYASRRSSSNATNRRSKPSSSSSSSETSSLESAWQRYFGTPTTTTTNTASESESSLLTTALLQINTTNLSSTLLVPLAVLLDEATDGWALTYADLRPETDRTPAGVLFLATNLAYTVVGLLLQVHDGGNVVLGTLTELASVASFAYHYTQLNLGPNQAPVRVALLVDYVVAGVTCVAFLVYLLTTTTAQEVTTTLPVEGLVGAALAVFCLALSWVWERGMPYIINHGLWHLFGAYAGYVIGMSAAASSSGHQ